MADLEPVVRENWDRHLAAAKLWCAHDFVPFDQGENFKMLGGRDWDSSQTKLPKHITDALEVFLITKDNLSAYHREFVEHFILEETWGHWIGRWTAEENLHAIVIREYLIVTRGVDPVANERVRVEHVMKGYRGDHLSRIETLVFMALRERTHAVFCRRLVDQIDDPTLRAMIETIATDEERHEQYFANLVSACLRLEPDETVAAVASRVAEMHVVGADIDAYQDKVANIAAAGIFDEDVLHRCVSDSIAGWGLAGRDELSGYVAR